MPNESKVGLQKTLVGGLGDYSGRTWAAIPFKIEAATKGEVEALAMQLGEEVAALVDSLDGVEWCESNADCSEDYELRAEPIGDSDGFDGKFDCIVGPEGVPYVSLGCIVDLFLRLGLSVQAQHKHRDADEECGETPQPNDDGVRAAPDEYDIAIAACELLMQRIENNTISPAELANVIAKFR